MKKNSSFISLFGWIETKQEEKALHRHRRFIPDLEGNHVNVPFSCD